MDFSTVFESARIMGTLDIVTAMLCSFVLCMWFAAIYRWTFQGFSYSRAFIHAMVLGGMVTAMLIMAIGNNLARGLGILGTLAVIRFRTPVRDPRDMIFLFACLASGIACGATTYLVGVVGAICVGLAALFLHFSPFASRRNMEGLLRFSMNVEADAVQDAVEKILADFCRKFDLVAMRETSQGHQLELAYHVRLYDPSYRMDLVEAVKKMDHVQDASLMMHRTTVEL
ncbi:MAG: DUF4956 domain-containing protein [Spartobacteria bacterium]|nr:DUF4956 domain-containing protein [Spartobacteria bacterium]